MLVKSIFFIDLGRAARVKFKEKNALYAINIVKNRCASRSILLSGGGDFAAQNLGISFRAKIPTHIPCTKLPQACPRRPPTPQAAHTARKWNCEVSVAR